MTKTANEIFAISATHLIKQGHKSLNKKGQCRYRGPKGAMCAIGPLIPKSAYSLYMEGKTLVGLVDGWDLPEFFKSNVALLCSLQIIHDFKEPSIWKEQLRDLGRRYNLMIPDVLKEEADGTTTP